MNGKEAIIDKIIGDAKLKAEEISSDAQKKADAIIADAQKKADSIVAESESAKKAAFDTVLANAEVVANLDCKKAMLTAKTALVGQVFDNAIAKLRADGKKYCDLIGKMIAASAEDGDKVNLNLPYRAAKFLLKAGLKFGGNDAMKNIDVDAIFEAAEQGCFGPIVDINSSDGDIVQIIIE